MITVAQCKFVYIGTALFPSIIVALQYDAGCCELFVDKTRYSVTKNDTVLLHITCTKIKKLF